MASTPPSQRTLSIGMRATEEGYVEVSITDHEPGMSPDQLKHIFEPFFTTKTQGTGLGLATSQQIIFEHNGHLVVESQPGKGSIFSILLPL